MPISQIKKLDPIDTDAPILVTGASGLLGGIMVDCLLKLGHSNILTTYRNQTFLGGFSKPSDQITWYKGDLTDPLFIDAIVPQVEYIIHCAAIISYDPRKKRKMIEQNTLMTRLLVNAALHYSIKKVIHVSSIAALGRNEYTSIISENAKWTKSGLNSNYGLSKYLSELEIWRGIAEGLNAVIINPSVIVGAGDWNKGSARFFSKIARGFPFYPIGGTGFVDAQDVTRFMYLLLHSNIHSERFILSGENLKYKDFFFQVANALRVKKPKIKVTPLLGNIAWRIAKIQGYLLNREPSITKETSKNSFQEWRFDTSKSLKAFPQFTYTPIHQSIIRTANKYLESN